MPSCRRPGCLTSTEHPSGLCAGCFAMDSFYEPVRVRCRDCNRAFEPQRQGAGHDTCYECLLYREVNGFQGASTLPIPHCRHQEGHLTCVRPRGHDGDHASSEGATWNEVMVTEPVELVPVDPLNAYEVPFPRPDRPIQREDLENLRQAIENEPLRVTGRDLIYTIGQDLPVDTVPALRNGETIQIQGPVITDEEIRQSGRVMRFEPTTRVRLSPGSPMSEPLSDEMVRAMTEAGQEAMARAMLEAEPVECPDCGNRRWTGDPSNPQECQCVATARPVPAGRIEEVSGSNQIPAGVQGISVSGPVRIGDRIQINGRTVGVVTAVEQTFSHVGFNQRVNFRPITLERTERRPEMLMDVDSTMADYTRAARIPNLTNPPPMPSRGVNPCGEIPLPASLTATPIRQFSTPRQVVPEGHVPPEPSWSAMEIEVLRRLIEDGAIPRAWVEQAVAVPIEMTVDIQVHGTEVVDLHEIVRRHLGIAPTPSIDPIGDSRRRSEKLAEILKATLPRTRFEREWPI